MNNLAYVPCLHVTTIKRSTPNDGIKVVRQPQMVVAWIMLGHMKKLKEPKPNGQLTL